VTELSARVGRDPEVPGLGPTRDGEAGRLLPIQERVPEFGLRGIGLIGVVLTGAADLRRLTR